MAKAKPSDGDAPLKRLGGGRWQTRDERFTIEPASGTWTVVDADQTDDLGLPLVRGPYRSLTDAKAGIDEARAEGAAASPLAERLEQARRSEASDGPEAATPKATGAARRQKPTAPEAPPEPRWIRDLEPDARRLARRLIDRLEGVGVADAEGVVRRDLVGDVASIATVAVAHRVAETLSRAGDDDGHAVDLASDIVEVLIEGRDGDLGVRWRLVDGEGRPIRLDPDEIRGAVTRTRKE